MLARTCCVLVLCLVFQATAEAGKVKVWQHGTQAQFDKAQFKQAVVSSEGTLRLSRQVKALANLQATHVWDVLEDAAGNLLVATGTEGKILKVAPDGKATELYASSKSQVLCLAQGPNGTVFAGTGPSGTVLRIAGDKVSVFAEELDAYVWDLVYDPQSKSLFAGTGSAGKIYQIQPDGKATVFYTTRQEHILRLAHDGKHLYAGTDKGGMVYRIDPRGKGFVVFHTPQGEIRSLLVTPEAIYAGTGSPVSRRDTTKTATGTGATPTTGENSLFRIAGDGTVREIFRDKVLILSLLKNPTGFWLGTGMQGQLFEVDEPTKEKTEVARLDHGQIHCLLKRRDGSMVLGTGDPGKLYVLEDSYTAEGTVTSEVLDAKIISKWGALTWKATTPMGTSVALSVRSGNVPEPDDTWSDWAADQTDPQLGKALAPAARYVQYRATLRSETGKATPEVRGIALRYQTTNQAPEIVSFDVPDLEAASQDSSRKLKLKWTATDPNEDDLVYSLHFKKDGWKDWVLLDEDLDKKDHEWDTSAVPSGVYQLKVVASDRRDNPMAETLTAERLSSPVVIAHDPPKVTLKLVAIEDDQAVIEGGATDALVRLTEAAFALNGKRWTNVFPTDGLFDSKSETFRFKTDALRPGSHVLRLRVRDAAGNVGASDVVFSVPRK